MTTMQNALNPVRLGFVILFWLLTASAFAQSGTGLTGKYYDTSSFGTLKTADKIELEHLLLQYPAARAPFWQRANCEALYEQWGEEDWGRKGLQLLPPVRHSRTGWVNAALAAAPATTDEPEKLEKQAAPEEPTAPVAYYRYMRVN